MDRKKTAAVAITGPHPTSWVGDITIEVMVDNLLLYTIRGPKSVRCEIDEDTCFTFRSANAFLPDMVCLAVGLLRCPTSIELRLIGGSLKNAKLVARITYGENYRR